MAASLLAVLRSRRSLVIGVTLLLVLVALYHPASHNQLSQLKTTYFPAYSPVNVDDYFNNDVWKEVKDPWNYKAHTEAKIRGLVECMAKGNCHPNAMKVRLEGDRDSQS
jgi:hypothetical protein